MHYESDGGDELADRACVIGSLIHYDDTVAKGFFQAKLKNESLYVLPEPPAQA
jgi:hypothetical protein